MMCRVTKIHITLHKKELTAEKNKKVIILEQPNACTFKVIYFKEKLVCCNSFSETGENNSNIQYKCMVYILLFFFVFLAQSFCFNTPI